MTEPPRRPHSAYVGTRQELGPEPTPDRVADRQQARHQPAPGPALVNDALGPQSGMPQPAGPAAATSPGSGADRWLRPGDPEDAVLTLAGRFADASAAAGYLGCLMDVAAADPAVHRADGDWWVTADARLSLARELVELSGGTPYVVSGDWLLRDRGWGPVPTPGGLPGPDDVTRSRLTDLPVTDLVVAAGLHRRPVPPHPHLTVLVPAARASSLLRRTADLQLLAAFRPVHLRPLFTDAPGDGAAGGSLIQVRLRTGHDRRHPLPTPLIRALDDDWRAVVLREVTEQLFVQHDRQSPLSDRQLTAVAGNDTWVIADPPFGCWSLQPLGKFTDADCLISFRPAHRLDPGSPAVTDAGSPTALPEPVPVAVVPSHRRDAPVDAVLLRDTDLDAVRLMLQGHPLADAVHIVPGRDHHLLIASGGIGERIPLGRYLTSAAPQPVFLPHGWRTDPVLPASAYAELVAKIPGHALVLEPDRTLVFDLDLRRPVWQLWAGPLPPVDLQLPDPAAAVLSAVDRVADPWGQDAAAPPRPPATPPGERLRDRGRGLRDRLRAAADRFRGPVTWQQQALDAELSGDLRGAARLHEDNGSQLKAARLYERAALGDTGEPRTSTWTGDAGEPER